MIGPLLFLPAGLLAAQITITEVSAEREAGRIAINVKSDAMIDPEATSAKLGEGRLYLFVYDARVHENNRAWQNDVAEGADEIRAHRHKQKVELAIPLGDTACQGPVELEKAAGGLRALVACDGGPRPSAARASHPSSASASARPETKAESRVTSVAVAASPTAVKADALGAALKAKLSLDPEPAAAPAVKPTSPKPAVAPSASASASASASVPKSLAKLAAPPASVASPTPTPTLTPTAGAPPAPHDPLALSSAGSGSNAPSGVVLGGGALLALAAAAFYFSRRRAAGGRRHIQILETASLGPKRALVVARVGDATMILGSSEAGITLLQSVPDADAPKQSGGTMVPELSFAPAPAAAPVSEVAPAKIVVEEPPMGAPVMVIPIAGTNNTWSLDKYGLPAIEEEIAAPVADVAPVGQAGLLSRLFKRGTPANDSPAPRFEDILEDSFEDQELRRKLALGLPGRVR
jgi:hypothetical protein